MRESQRVRQSPPDPADRLREVVGRQRVAVAECCRVETSLSLRVRVEGIEDGAARLRHTAVIVDRVDDRAEVRPGDVLEAEAAPPVSASRNAEKTLTM